ncbi:hypothetical protein VZQ01_38820 [Myxococcus faecalis]|uniref:hypothetical protein n=1 Tax=Myxococcus faecalis TaxID=3115646 RepID=UPI003CE7BE69
MRTSLYGLGLLMAWGPVSPAFADTPPPPPEPEQERRIPQVAVDVGGGWGRMQHPTTDIPGLRNEVRTVGARANAVRLAGGIHFNMVRGSGRTDWWWTNGVDWYLLGDDVQVLALRPGLEKRLSITDSLSLGVSLFGAASEVSLATGRISANIPGTGGGDPVIDGRYFQARSRKWIFGGGAGAALQYQLNRWFHTRMQVGYTQFVSQAKNFQVSPVKGPDSFSVSLSGPWAAAYVGVGL